MTDLFCRVNRDDAAREWLGFDISKYIDASYVQKAVSLGLDKSH